MSFKGIHLRVLAGKPVPRPLSASMIQALVEVEIIQSSQARSGFRLIFQTGRKRGEFPISTAGRLEPFNRVILSVFMKARLLVLFDGMITHRQFDPGRLPNLGRFTVMGEDLSVLMDLEERREAYPACDDFMMVNKILSRYSRYGLVPAVKKPPHASRPKPNGRVPMQTCTDLGQLQILARRHGFSFFVEPGPRPMTGEAYWGPPRKSGTPQPALTVGLGSAANVRNIQFSYDAFKPLRITDWLQDPQSNETRSLKVNKPEGPFLAKHSVLDDLGNNTRTVLMAHSGGHGYQQALAGAQGRADLGGEAITAEGELDARAYGGLLRARRLVGLRGVGLRYDGNYYVEKVRHLMKKGEYNAFFTLSREGTGAKSPRVAV